MKNWYLSLSERDRKIVLALGASISLLMIYTFVWMPLIKDNQQLEKRIEVSQTDLQWMKKASEKIKAHGPISNKPSGARKSSDSFLTLIEKTAASNNIKLDKVTPKKDQQVEIRLKEVSFNQAIDWVQMLEKRHGIRVSKFSSEKVAEGQVNLAIVLEG